MTDTDLGYAQIVKNFAALSKAGIGGREGPGVFVGVRTGAGDHPSGVPFIEIAAANEFGTTDGHVPERSYLRSTVDAKRDTYARQLSRDLTKAFDEKTPNATAFLRRALGLLGARAVGDVQRTMTKLSDPANAPSTIEKKGADNPLIDDGRLRQSIDFEVRGV